MKKKLFKMGKESISANLDKLPVDLGKEILIKMKENEYFDKKFKDL